MAEGRGRDRERSLDPQKQRGGWSLREPKVCRGSSRGPASRLKCSLVLKPPSGHEARCPVDPSSLGSHSRALPHWRPPFWLWSLSRGRIRDPSSICPRQHPTR